MQNTTTLNTIHSEDFKAKGKWLNFVNLLMGIENDNQASGSSKDTQAGVNYGQRLIGLILLLVPSHYFIQKIVVGLNIWSLALPSGMILLQLLLNDEEFLGKRVMNKTWRNVIHWSATLVLLTLVLVLAVQNILPSVLVQPGR